METLANVILEESPKGLYIRQQELLKILPFSRATLWRKVKAKDFPQPIRLSKKIHAWRKADINNWIEKLHNPTPPPN